MLPWIKTALVALAFDYLYDQLMHVLMRYADDTRTPIDNKAVQWLIDMKAIFKGEVKRL